MKFYVASISSLLLLSDCNTTVETKQAQNAWYTLLPNCPCKNPDWQGVQTTDGWAEDKGDIHKYHSGAYQCFRSYPYRVTPEGKSGQQCCYDKSGKLIRSGSGAGTPDKVSTCSGEDKHGVMTLRFAGLIGHYVKDVMPWQKAGKSGNSWKTYNLLWVPNQGKNCAFEN